MKSVSWIWSSLGVLWFSSSGSGECGPCRVSWSGAVFVNTGGFAWVGAVVLNWISLELDELLELFLISLNEESSSWPEIGRIKIVDFHMEFWFKIGNLFWSIITII